MIRPPPKSTLFPYPTLFRSQRNLLAPDVGGHLCGHVLHGAGPVSSVPRRARPSRPRRRRRLRPPRRVHTPAAADRKSTRLNSSHANISYAVFCLKKKKKKQM